MILAIDRGNTRDKYCVFDKNNLVFSNSVLVIEEEILNNLFQSFDISCVIVSSVKTDKENEGLHKFLQKNDAKIYEFSRLSSLPFVNAYLDKSTIGLDRLAVISGASVLFGNNVLVVDAGTCITFDFLDSNNVYQGGSISLGIATKYKALHNFTANLPLIESIESVDLCAKTTKDCIISGVINGTIFEVEKMIEHYKQKEQGLKVVLTGGDARFLHQNLKTPTQVEENLLFYGLKKILELNV